MSPGTLINRNPHMYSSPGTLIKFQLRYFILVKCVNPTLGGNGTGNREFGRFLLWAIWVQPHYMQHQPRCAYGAPISRKRLFIIMVRRDCLKEGLLDSELFSNFWDEIAGNVGMSCDPEFTW